MDKINSNIPGEFTVIEEKIGYSNMIAILEV